MKKVILFLCSLLLIGCAGGERASDTQDRIAKQFATPNDGTTNLYIYRNEMFGGAVNMDILIDGQPVAITGPKTYILTNIASGKHKVDGIAFEGTSSIEIDAVANTLKFIRQEVKMGILGARNKLHEVSEQEGKTGVLESKLLISNPIRATQQISLNSERTIYDSNNIRSPKQYTESMKVSTKSKKVKSNSKRSYQFSGGCSCYGNNACYGPRGGRYCITSGGNKRYF